MKKIVIALTVLFICQLVAGQDILKIFSDTSMIKYGLWKQESSKNYLMTEALNANDKEGFYRSGLEKLKKGQYGQAVSDLKKALVDKEEYFTEGIPEIRKNKILNEILYAIGYSFFKWNEPDSAAFYFRKITVIDPYYETAWIALSQIEADNGNIDSAVAVLESAETVLPKSPVIPFQIGAYYFYGNQPEKAKKALEQVVSHFPGFDESYLFLGLIYMDESNPSEALSFFKKYTQLNPEDYMVNVLMGIEALNLNDYEAAYRYILKFSENDTIGFPYLSDQLALLEIMTGRENQGFKRLYNYRKELYSDSVVYKMETPLERFAFPLLKDLALKKFPRKEMKYIIKYFKDSYWDSDETEIKKNLDEYVEAKPASLFAKQFRLYGYLTLKQISDLSYKTELTDQINSLMDITPDDPYLWFFLGSLLNHPDELPDAIEMYETGSQMLPDYFFPYYLIGETYFALKEYDSAIIYCTKVIDCCPDFWQAYSIRGYSYYFTNKKQKAVNDLVKYLKLVPDDEKDLAEIEKLKSILVESYIGLNKPDSAILYIKDTKFKDIRNDLAKRGNVFYNSGRFNEAIGYYTKTIEMSNSINDHNPETVQVYFQRGNAYLALEKDSLALNDFLLAMRSDSVNINYIIASGQAYCGLKKYNTALTLFNKAAKIEPRNIKVYGATAKCLIAAKQYNKALQYLHTAVRVDSNYAEGYGQLSFVNYRLGNYKGSIIDSYLAIRLDNNLSYPYFYAALSMLRLDMVEMASVMIRRFTASALANGYVLNTAQIQDIKDLYKDGVIDSDEKQQLIIYIADAFKTDTEKLGIKNSQPNR